MCLLTIITRVSIKGSRLLLCSWNMVMNCMLLLIMLNIILKPRSLHMLSFQRMKQSCKYFSSSPSNSNEMKHHIFNVIICIFKFLSNSLQSSKSLGQFVFPLKYHVIVDSKLYEFVLEDKYQQCDDTPGDLF